MRAVLAIVMILAIIGSTLLGAYFILKWLYAKFIAYQNSNPKKIEIDTEKKEISMPKQIKNTLTIRFIIIGVIALIMLIPLSTVEEIVYERNGLYNKVLQDIARQWGNPQKIVGPALILPIIEKYTIIEKTILNDGNIKETAKDILKHKNIVILPKTLQKDITINEHYRYRSIYKSLVYEADIEIKGSFVIPDLSKLSDNIHKVRYDKAYVIMGLSDTKAINKVSSFDFNEHKSEFNPSTKITLQGINSGFHALVTMDEKNINYPFSFSFNTKGSSSIRFSALGETNTIHVKSSWQHPSFQGDILPTQREINEKGFTAQWSIPSLARSFPQSWIAENSKEQLNSLLTGVDLYEPVVLYSLVSRAIKYGGLFIILTFLTFLIFELTQKTKLHYVQYTLIGLSLGIFFLGLLSLSEHIDFLLAYIISSMITISSISIYTWFNAKNIKQSLSIFVLLLALYIILYSLLQLEDYALLMGTGLLLSILFVLMWITRNLRGE